MERWKGFGRRADTSIAVEVFAVVVEFEEVVGGLVGAVSEVRMALSWRKATPMCWG